jgi:hypothetical protein
MSSRKGEYRRPSRADHVIPEQQALPPQITIGPDMLQRLLDLEGAVLTLRAELRKLHVIASRKNP